MAARRPHWTAPALAVLVVLSCLLAPAAARGASIDGGKLDVTTNEFGGLQAYSGGTRLFYSTGYSGFFLRFADGPLADRTFGPGWTGATRLAPVSQSAVTRAGDVQSQEIVYDALDGAAAVARVHQTVRVRDGARTFRVTYSVENRTGSPLRLRATAGGDLYVGEGDGGTGFASAGPPRLVGNESPSGVRGAAEEVLRSELPGDAAPVAVAAWSARQQGNRFNLQDALVSAGGLVDGVKTTNDYDTALAVQWDDHFAEGDGIAPGATARYELVWHPHIPPRLVLSANKTTHYFGSTHTVTGRVSDSSGNPVVGATLRWSVAGAHPGTGGTLTTGASGTSELSYTGERAGSDVITVFADVDGDGVRGPEEPQRIASVFWQSPLTLQQTEWGWRVGERQAFRVELRNLEGNNISGAPIRWSVTGTNPTATSRTAITGQYGAEIALTARHAGDDTLTAFVDTDGDGARGGGELEVSSPVRWAPPPPPVVLARRTWPTVPSAALVDVTVRDEYGIVIADAALRWWAEGVNPHGPADTRSDAAGRASLSIAGEHSGAGTVWVHFDRDEDGERDSDEFATSLAISWSAQPPPPVTRQTLDSAGLDVTVSSVGSLQARFDALAGIPRTALFDEYEGGFFVRFLDGPNAGRTFGTSGYGGFYGDPQQAPTRAADTVTQRSSWTVRAADDDVLRVHQVARVRDGDERVRMTWSVENLADEPVRLRVGTSGDLLLDGADTGTPVQDEAPVRFIGVEHPSGFAAGLEATTTSRLPADDADVPVPAWSGFGIGAAWRMTDAMGTTAGLASAVSEPATGDGVAVQWADHAAPGEALAPGAAAAARYEAVWRLRRPAALRLSPPADVAETRREHRVTATLLDDLEQPRNGVRLRWSITGVHPQQGSATSTGLGQTVIAWTGRHVGRDEVTVFADEDDDGVRDPEESQRTVSVDWRTETAVDPPVIAPLIRPDGRIVQVSLQTQGDRRFLQIPAPDVGSFPRCADGSPKLDLSVSVNIDPGAGAVVAGSVSLLTVNPATNDLEHPLGSILPVGEAVAGTFGFVIECIRQASMYLCYELVEVGLPIERFCVLLGGVGLYDPSGIVYDAAAAAALVAGGIAPKQARLQSAVAGARVVLQRSHAGAFRQVLSGDPFVTPNVNPIVTDVDGRFAWNVSPGTYRLVVSAEGYTTRTSRTATIPPPDLEVDVGLYRDGQTPPPDEPPDTDPSPASHAAIEPSPAAVPAATPPPPAAPLAPPVPWDPYANTNLPATPAPSAAPAPRTPQGAPAQLAFARRVGAAALDRRGVVRVRLACPPSINGGCGGKITVRSTSGRRLGSAHFAIAPGASRQVTVRLGAKARSARRVAVAIVQPGARSIRVTARRSAG